MKLELLSGPYDGDELSSRKSRILLGRAAENDFPFPYAMMVSSRHALIEKEGENRYYITDTGNDGRGSTNGTAVVKRNGQAVPIGKQEPVPPGGKVRLEAGDVIVLGCSVWLKFLGD